MRLFRATPLPNFIDCIHLVPELKMRKVLKYESNLQEDTIFKAAIDQLKYGI